MSKKSRKPSAERVEVCSIEADMAFFEARLSLAGDHPDTVYQAAQIKTYKTLGVLLADRLRAIRPAVGTPSAKLKSRAR